MKRMESHLQLPKSEIKNKKIHHKRTRNENDKTLSLRNPGSQSHLTASKKNSNHFGTITQLSMAKDENTELTKALKKARSELLRLKEDKAIAKEKLENTLHILAETNQKLKNINESHKEIFSILGIIEDPKTEDGWKHATSCIKSLVEADKQLKNDYEQLQIKNFGKEKVEDQQLIKSLQYALKSRESDLELAQSHLSIQNTRIKFAKLVDRQNCELSKSIYRLYFHLNSESPSQMRPLILAIIFGNRFFNYVQKTTREFDPNSLSFFLPREQISLPVVSKNIQEKFLIMSRNLLKAKEEIKQLSIENQVNKDNLTSLKNQINDFSFQRKNDQQQIQFLKDRIEELQQQNQKLICPDQLIQIRNDNQILQQRNAELERIIKEKHEEIQELESQKHDLTEKLKVAQKQFHNEFKENQNFKKELTKVYEDCHHLENMNHISYKNMLSLERSAFSNHPISSNLHTLNEQYSICINPAFL